MNKFVLSSYIGGPHGCFDPTRGPRPGVMDMGPPGFMRGPPPMLEPPEVAEW